MLKTSEASPVPLYLQVADTLRQRIDRGVWETGECIPTLDQLAKEFQVARVTVRQAVQILTAQGALAPRRGLGTFVTGSPARSKTIKVETTLDALAEVYRSTTPELLTIDEHSRCPPIRPSDGALAERYTYMKRIHFRDGEPYCVISLYLDERIFSLSPQRFRTETVIPLLLALPGVVVAKAYQTLTIGSADSETARLLRVPANSPIANVLRVFRDESDTVIYYAEVAYRGDVVRLEMDLSAPGAIAPKRR